VDEIKNYNKRKGKRKLITLKKVLGGRSGEFRTRDRRKV
jgi:hypothetical protein